MLRESQATICKAVEAMEQGRVCFREDVWKRAENGGGGRTCLLQDGSVFEKAGVNVSAVYGDLPAEAASVMMAENFTEILDASIAAARTAGNHGVTFKTDVVRFYAAGLSLVIHPVNPMAPTVHMNYRMLQIFAKKANGTADTAATQQASKAESTTSRSECQAACAATGSNGSEPQSDTSEIEHEHGVSVLWWFGGGTDLSPAYPFEEDCIFFHQMLRDQCDRCDPLYYSRFKRWCDAYFRIHHRNEGRGIGGIFFDDLNEGMTVNPEKFFRFAEDGLQRTFLKAYLPLVEKRMKNPFTPREKVWQQIRRGRYVEFNLVHDRGTRFGLLMPGSRIESVLVSLPLTARWEYEHKVEENSPEAAALAIFKRPRDWIAINEEALKGFKVPTGPKAKRKL
ncbi:UNVERIFIED_CONTAM: hypothetical protein H355_013852 [Colinus virginianus]|nr:hypothetical protein H355_013852 [Colinus virginianus]